MYVRVYVSLRISMNLSKNSSSPFGPKYLIKNFIQKSFVNRNTYIEHTYTYPSRPVRVLPRRCVLVPLEPNRARNTAREKTRLESSSFSPLSEQKCFIAFRSPEIRDSEEIWGRAFPPATEISDFEIFFRISDRFREQLSSRA